MSQPTPPPPAAPARKPPARGSLSGWVQTHKGAAGAGGVAVAGVIGLALYQRYKNSQASSSTSAGTSTTGTGVQGTYDSTAQDIYDQLEQQIVALQSQIAQSSTNAASGGATIRVVPPAPTPAPAGGPRSAPKPMPPIAANYIPTWTSSSGTIGPPVKVTL